MDMGKRSQLHEIINQVVAGTDGYIKLAVPLGLGKPNRFVNALYRYVRDNPEIKLDIYTALSLEKPKASSALEKRFLDPFVERVYADYEELDYIADLKKKTIPENIRIYEFFFRPGSMLSNACAQQNYICTNYTFVARDLAARGVNVLAQLVASENANTESLSFSLSCNPEVTLELRTYIEQQKCAGKPVFSIAEVHSGLPYMTGDAEVPADFFDFIVSTPVTSRLFSTPNMPVSLQDHFIGLHTSSLVADGGTIQIGIGSLGDALVHHLLHRHQDEQGYRQLLSKWDYDEFQRQLIARDGGVTRFEEGLYGCSEMVTQALLGLWEGGIIKRQVDEKGTMIHGGFFLGPLAFYRRLAALSEEERQQIQMTSIGFVNQLYGDQALKQSQRVKARFINTAFTMTLMGAAVSDQLDSGAVLSGVGGQYNFVSQAQALPDARSVLLLRSWRERKGKPQSNIVWSYAHNTIPRHLKDVVVTEYGMADLRAKSDAETIAAMLNICDSRFQEELLQQAQAAGKLPLDYSIPETHRNNFPETLEKIAGGFSGDVFSRFPLGTDFDQLEQELLLGLGWLKEKVSQREYIKLARSAAASLENGAARFQPHLQRMGLDETETAGERIMQVLLLTALESVH